MKHIFYLFFLLLILTASCDYSATNRPFIKPLDQNWEFSRLDADEWLPAVVPGTVHSDLLLNGVISDPHYRTNEDDVQWIEKEDWVYRSFFYIGENFLLKQNIALEIKGMDTYASVFLNDSLVLSSNNMFMGWVVDVKRHLKQGENELKVIFKSPVKEGMKKLTQLDYIIPAINEQAPEGKRSNVFSRKAPFHFGWDWGPRLVTSGIWREINLKAWDSAVINDIYVSTASLTKRRAKLDLQAGFKVAQEGNYRLKLSVNGSKLWETSELYLNAGEQDFQKSFHIDQPRLWWSNGLGEPYLYRFTFTLTKDEVIVDRKEMQFGIRTLKLVQEPDNAGRSFYFELNGVPVFMKGANIIPSNTLTPMVTESEYKRLIDNAVKANMNMLRVWGGAIYENDIFYQLCDQNGILVWQDFMFACALQPGDEQHLENIAHEAAYNVKRLRNHPSMALWCGNNENLHGWHHWGWKNSFEPDVQDFMWRTYERIFYEILPNAVRSYSGHIQYWASSPSAYNNRLADRRSGDEHDWTIWFGQRPLSDFGVNVPRFVSEYGLQAFPTMHTIRDFSVEDDWDIDSPVMRHRQRSKMDYIQQGFDGNDMIKRYMERYYRVPDNFEHFVYVSQLLQAKAYKMALEAHRRNMPQCMGSLYWQLNDSWPTISWSTVDYYGRWKAAHYAVQKANKSVMVSPIIEDQMISVFVVNDHLKVFDKAKLNITFYDFDGNEISSLNKSIKLKANSSNLVFNRNVEEYVEGSNLYQTIALVQVFNADSLLDENILYFFEPKDLQLSKAAINKQLSKTKNGYELIISSDRLVKNLFIDTTIPDAIISDNYFDMIPGHPKTIQLITNKSIETEDEVFLLSLNDLQ